MGRIDLGRHLGELVFLGLGSNLGDREVNLRRALEMIAQHISLERVSSVYETEPWGFHDQPRFFNCVCAGHTSMEPRPLLSTLKQVERALGREPTFRNGPRAIDVDVLFYGARAVSEPELEIPHPRLAERTFVLEPLVEIAGDLVHPVLGLTVSQLLDRITPERVTECLRVAGVDLWPAQVARRLQSEP